MRHCMIQWRLTKKWRHCPPLRLPLAAIRSWIYRCTCMLLTTITVNIPLPLTTHVGAAAVKAGEHRPWFSHDHSSFTPVHIIWRIKFESLSFCALNNLHQIAAINSLRVPQRVQKTANHCSAPQPHNSRLFRSPDSEVTVLFRATESWERK